MEGHDRQRYKAWHRMMMMINAEGGIHGAFVK